MPIMHSPRSTRRRSRFPQSPLAPAFLFRSAEVLVKLKRTDDARKRFLKVAETYPGDPWADDAVARTANWRWMPAITPLRCRLRGRFPSGFRKASSGPTFA